MLKQHFKTLSIGKKILVTIIAVSIIAQISVAILTFNSIFTLADYTQNETASLGNFTSKKSKDALKNQAESYLKEISFSMSEASDNILEEISDQVTSLSISAEDIYQNEYKFNGHNLPLPETIQSNNDSDRSNATEKAYAIDSKNISSDNETILAYNPNFYDSHLKKDIYTTTIEDWIKLNSEERKNIQQNKIVVSKNSIPKNLQKEIQTLSNLSHVAKSIYESNITVSSVYVGTQSGISYRYSPGNSYERFDPRVRPWYTDAVTEYQNKNSLPVWQSAYIGKSDGKLCITCSKVFKNKNNEILGVVAIDMYLENLNKYIIGTTIGNTGYAFVTDQNGKIIMHPEYMSQESKSFETKPLDSSTTTQSYKNIITEMKSLKSGVSTAEVNGKEYYIAYSPLTTPKWSLGAAAEIGDILMPAIQTEQTIVSSAKNTQSHIKFELIKVIIQFLITFIICSILTYIIAIKLSKKILNPIKKLRNQAKTIGEGDFSSRIPVESKDEIGDLSHSFNLMAENLKIYMDNLEKTTAQKEKIHSELMIAKKIQTSMLPCIFPAFPDRKDFDIYAMMDPAKEVGGDFYDFFWVDNTHLALVIADVSDKGVSAALFMVIAKILIKNQFQSGDSPAKVLETVNKQLCENNEAGMFVTAFTGIVDIKTGEFTFANAGHNPPFIYKKSEDKYVFMDSPHGFVLGGIPDVKYEENKTYFNREDFIFLYTDGVTEAMNCEGKLFSTEKLKAILNSPKTKKLSMKDIILSLRQEIDKFANTAERTDDITMLAFKDFEIPDFENQNL